MKRFKQIFLSLLGIIFGLLTLVFGLLNTKYVQDYAKGIIVSELQQKLNTDLGISHLYFRPFNTVGLDSVYVNDKAGNAILLASNISASVDIYELLKQNIVISSAWLTNFDVHLSKASADSTLNIQFIVDAFKSKNDTPKSKLDIRINAINIADGRFYYDVLDEKENKSKFNKNHIAVKDLHAKLALKSLQNNSLNIQVRKLGLKERSGFEITNFVGRLVTKDEFVSVLGFELLLPNSRVAISKLDLVLPKASKDTIEGEKHTHDNDTKIDFVLSPSYLSPKDISAFVPELRHFDDRVNLRANISGYEHNLTMSNLTLTFGDKLRLVANAEVRDWFDEGDTYISAVVDELRVSGKDIEKIANSFSSKKVSIPQGIVNQQDITFRGDLSGYLEQLKAFGTLDTDDGVVRTDVSLGFNKKEKVFSYSKGKIYTTNFELGDFLGDKNLGNTSFEIEVDIEKPLYKEFKGDVKGVIHDFAYKNYVYKDITVDVRYADKKVEGALLVNDENGIVDLNGFLDMKNEKKPKLNVVARVDNLKLDNLHLLDSWNNSNLSFSIDADFEGSDIDNIQGYVKLDSLELYKGEHFFELKNLLLEASGLSENENRKIELKSDIINGYVEGQSSLKNLINTLKYALHEKFPTLIHDVKDKPKASNNFTYRFDINNTEQLSQILNLPIIIYEPASINGFFDSSNDLFKLEVKTPLIGAGGMNILSGYVVVENNEQELTSTIKALIEGKNQILNDVVIKSSGKEDAVNTSIHFINNSKSKAEGTFNILTEFDYRGREKGLRTRVNIDESKLLLNDAKWKLEKSAIAFEKGLIDVDNFWIYTEDKKQELRINGKYSKHDSRNILKTELKDIDLAYIFETLAIDALKFGGAASGSVFLSSIDEKPYANTRLEVTDFMFNDTKLGKLSLFSELDDETKEVMMDGSIISPENKRTKVDGIIDPIKQTLSIHFDADSVDIGFLYAYSKSIFDNVSGHGSGQVHLHGNFSHVTVEGVARIMEGKVGIKFLNTDYTFSDLVYLREGLIYFNDIEFKDKFGNIAYGNGKIAHNYFKDIMYHIEMNADNFLLYNATENHNPIFYGQVFGSGKGILGGDERELNIDINMQTKENTLVRMNFMEDEISEYSFISYKEPEKTEETLTKRELLKPIKTESDMEINMNFYIDATPDATFEMIMDPIGGDVLKGSGSGAMQFIWSSKLEPQLYGTFNVARGSYNFTFQRIMERKFSIQSGSTIQFRGDPFQANLDVSAIYKVTASLSDLDRTLVEDSGQSSLPVNCILNLTGLLKRPNVALDIKFPTANAEVERQIKSHMDTEDMINRQVTYLLLLSKFYTPATGSVDHPSSDFTVMASATLSNQLTKIISQIDKRWQLGTHIRMGDTELNNTEVELLLSSQLLNDRLLINGNFGYRSNNNVVDETNKNAVITDVDIEYLLNLSGTWRVKAYNHYNEKFYYMQDRGNMQTQGVGILYRRDFDKFNELWPFGKKIAKPVKQDSIHHVLPDSIKKGSPLSSFVKFGK